MQKTMPKGPQETHQPHRRKALKNGLSMFALSVLTTTTQHSRGNSKQRIIVVGSGIAGLAAARDLVNAGHEVMVIEAQNRIGGRLKTDSSSLSIPMDLGASWIHGVTGNPITALAKAAGANLLETKYSNSVLYDGSSLLDSDALDPLDTLIDKAIQWGQEQDTDEAVFSTVWKRTRAAQLTAVQRQRLLFLMNGKLDSEYAGAGTNAGKTAVGDLSTLYFDRAKSYPGGDKLFKQGYGQIADFLKTGLTIRLHEKVTAIDYAQASVTVATDKGIYTADKVLVTVPLGVLKKGLIAFTPALPSTHTKAIEQIGMGLLNKLYLEFDHAFWKKEWGANNYDWIQSIPPLVNGAPATEQRWDQWVSFDNTAGKPILLAFSAAKAAESLEALSDQAIQDEAMARLKTMFGAEALPPIKMLRTQWASDVYTYGSYSFNKTGMSPTARKVLATPIYSRLFFAGEAASHDYFGTVHGAYLSGVNAAALIKG